MYGVAPAMSEWVGAMRDDGDGDRGDVVSIVSR